MAQARNRALAAALVAGLVCLWLALSGGVARAEGDTPTAPASGAAQSAPSSQPAGGSSSSAGGSPTSGAAPSPAAEQAPGPSDTVVSPGPTASTPLVAISSSSGNSTNGVPDSPTGSGSSSGSSLPTTRPTDGNPPPPTAAAVAAANAATEAMRHVVQHFVPAVLDSVGDAGCDRCDTAIAVSVGGDSYAGASLPGATQASAASDAQAGGVAGATGDATAVSVSADGDATADAAAGTVGGSGASTGAGGSAAPVEDLAVHEHRLVHAITDLLSGLLDANGSASHSFQLSSCGPSLCISGGSATAELASSSATSAGDGAVLVSIALGGTPHVSLPQATGVSGAAACTSGTASEGLASSVAVAVRGDAQATIRAPGSTSCSGATQTAQTQSAQTQPADTTAPSHAAGSGATGNALSVALTAHGPASARAVSGNSGRASTGGVAGSGPDDTELARSGVTGAAVGVAIAKLGATSTVRSGDSGQATAICSGCGIGHGGASYTNSVSGDTGLSFVLALAGRQAYVQSESGDSGEAISWVVDRTGEPVGTESPATGTSGVARTNRGGQVVVSGQSGGTGNVVVISVGPDSSVAVWSESGHSGPVHSIATWGLGKCRAEIATFQVVCDPPPPGSRPGTSTGSGTGSGPGPLGHVKIVISPGDAGGPHVALASAPGPETSGAVADSGNATSQAADSYTGKYVPAAARQRSRVAANLVPRVALIAGAAILPTLLLLWWVISRGDGEAWPNASRLRRETDDR